MKEEQIVDQEYNYSGTTITKNESFEENGFLLLKNLCEPNGMFSPVPKERGVLSWWGKNYNEYRHTSEEEAQVNGSVSRYFYPQYIDVHNQIRKVLESKLGKRLYNTYYYERFYFPGQELKKHVDRDACEISVTVHISSNIKEPWPIWVKSADKYIDKEKTELKEEGIIYPVFLLPGDGLVYKGCERPHWREWMPGTLQTYLNKKNNKESKQLYYHQIFFHYVLQDGIRAHHAWDKLN